jgi:hypothetical protein
VGEVGLAADHVNIAAAQTDIIQLAVRQFAQCAAGYAGIIPNGEMAPHGAARDDS